MSPPTYAAQVHNADVERTRLCALQASLDGEPALPDSAAPPPFVTRSHSDAAVRGYLFILRDGHQKLHEKFV